MCEERKKQTRKELSRALDGERHHPESAPTPQAQRSSRSRPPQTPVPASGQASSFPNPARKPRAPTPSSGSVTWQNRSELGGAPGAPPVGSKRRPPRNSHAGETPGARELLGKGAAGDPLRLPTPLTRAFPSRPAGSPQSASHGRGRPVHESPFAHGNPTFSRSLHLIRTGSSRDGTTDHSAAHAGTAELLSSQPGEGAGLRAQS
ncbi:uncharacterized protein LOC144581890 [Callithrix jacchus]